VSALPLLSLLKLLSYHRLSSAAESSGFGSGGVFNGIKITLRIALKQAAAPQLHNCVLCVIAYSSKLRAVECFCFGIGYLKGIKETNSGKQPSALVIKPSGLNLLLLYLLRFPIPLPR
jgi:hypothetical protein